MGRDCFIYALWRRDEELPFYVGRTVDTAARMKAHYPKQAGGMQPGEFVVLDSCPEELSKELERKWIRDIYKLNPNLKNQNEVERFQVSSVIRNGFVTIFIKDSDAGHKVVGARKIPLSAVCHEIHAVIKDTQKWAQDLGCEQRQLSHVVELVNTAQRLGAS